MCLNTVKSSEMCLTTSWSSPMSTLSSTSKGCLTNRKMQEPRTSWAVVAKTKDNDSKAVPAVASVVVKELFKKATIALSVAAHNQSTGRTYQKQTQRR